MQNAKRSKKCKMQNKARIILSPHHSMQIWVKFRLFWNSEAFCGAYNLHGRKDELLEKGPMTVVQRRGSPHSSLRQKMMDSQPIFACLEWFKLDVEKCGRAFQQSIRLGEWEWNVCTALEKSIALLWSCNNKNHWFVQEGRQKVFLFGLKKASKTGGEMSGLLFSKGGF